MKRNIEAEELSAQLKGSFLLFTQTFFPFVTGRPFHLSSPIGRESHFITIARELTSAFRLEFNSLVINVPPGSGKSTMVAMWVAWCMASYPDSQFLYISYAKSLAKKHTEFIRRIMKCPQYRSIFNIEIKSDSKAKDNFQTLQGGSVQGFGSSGPVTGQDGGLPLGQGATLRFTGAVIIDDPHKPDEVHSDGIREGVIKNYNETILQRVRGLHVPIIFIGQCLHEMDLAMYLRSGVDERKWKTLILQSIDECGNALYPDVNPIEQLLDKKEKNPYVFYSQYQQEPVPAGGALFKEKDFIILDNEPKIIKTFITADTAETDKTYNDATVFSFWGIYKITEMGRETGQIGLHCLDCMEVRIEPKDLEYEFTSFYSGCMQHEVKPLVAFIEKKSTGTTLVSVIEKFRGLDIREITRSGAKYGKTERFLRMQPIISAKLISLTYSAKHVAMFIKHMIKITANQTHRFDDICDTVYDAINVVYLDKTGFAMDGNESSQIVKSMAAAFNEQLRLRSIATQWRR